MGNMLRWSEEDLQKHLGKNKISSLPAVATKGLKTIKETIDGPVTGEKSSSTTQDGLPSLPKIKKSSLRKKKSAPVICDLFEETNPPAKEKKKSSTAFQRAKQASESLRMAKVSGEQVAGKYIEFTFDGARLLSLNDLYALSHFQRVGYRKAWHEVMHNAVLEITGGPVHLHQFKKFHIQAHRSSVQYCDLDALSSYFKYAIDGLRYAGVIIDDNPSHMVSIASTQEKGPYLVRIRVETVDEASPSPAGSSFVSSVQFDKTRPK